MVAATQLPPCVPTSSPSPRQTRRLESLGKRREDLRHLGNAERDLSRPDGTKAGRPSEWARASQRGGEESEFCRILPRMVRTLLPLFPRHPFQMDNDSPQNNAKQSYTNQNKPKQTFCTPGGRGCQHFIRSKAFMSCLGSKTRLIFV